MDRSPGAKLSAATFDIEEWGRGLVADGWKEPKKESPDYQYQLLYDYWRENTEFPKEFPSVLSLGASPPIVSSGMLGDQILITKGYDTLYDRLLEVRAQDERGGAVITGQPGVGKTTFLAYLLARLISGKQAVVLFNCSSTFLFCRGKVYRFPGSGGFENLPPGMGTKSEPVWALIDWDDPTNGPPVSRAVNIWPVQASSPKRDRWRAWAKQRDAAVLGLPLWEEDELRKGLRLQVRFSRFLSLLRESLKTPTANGPLDSVLKVLRSRGYGEPDGDADVSVEYIPVDKTGGVTNVSAEGQDTMMVDEAGGGTDKDGGVLDEAKCHIDEAGRKSLNKALNILVTNAIEEFGFVPRHVYQGVFHLDKVRYAHHREVTNFEYSKFRDLVHDVGEPLDPAKYSHYVVAVHPVRATLWQDNWEISFKSAVVKKQMMVQSHKEEYKELRRMYSTFHEIPEASSFAGNFFEAIVHRTFTCRGSNEAGQALDPTSMTSDGRNPPTFSASRSNPTTPLAVNEKMDAVFVNLKASEFNRVVLSNDKYYIPSAPNNPLFDSFIVSPNLETFTAVISVFQMTVSSRHAGSGDGYSLIRGLMKHVHDLLKNQPGPIRRRKPKITVKYFLVTPFQEGEPEPKWAMPVGWDEKCSDEDHRGEAFWIRFNP